MSSQSAGFIPLIKTRVLYLGSSVPLETSLGLESVQQPLRDRYGGGGSGGFDVKVTGVDTILTVFSSGLLLEYVEDPTASTWFPIQTLHVCCSVRPARQGYDLRFVPLDSPEADKSKEPPIFAAITRRSKGIKVLECHGFLCKTPDTAMALVQCCTHAFQHKEGWLDETPPIERMKQTATRLIPAEQIAERRAQPGFKGEPKTYAVGSGSGPVQPKCSPYEMQTLVVNLPPQHQPQPQPQPQPPPVQNPPPPQPPKGYFANWSESADQAVMISPQSPFFPGQSFIIEQEEKKKKKKHKKKKKSRKEVEYLIIKKSGQTNGKSSRDDHYYDDDDDYYDDDDDDVAVIYPGGNQGNAGAQIQEQPGPSYVPYYYDYGMDQSLDAGMDYYPAFDFGGYAGYPGFDQGAGYPALDQGAYYPAFDQGANYPGFDQGFGQGYPAFDQGFGQGYPALDQGFGQGYPASDQGFGQGYPASDQGGYVQGYGY